MKKSRNSSGMLSLNNGKNLYKLTVSNLLTLNNINIESIPIMRIKRGQRIENEMNKIKKNLILISLKEFAKHLKKNKNNLNQV